MTYPTSNLDYGSGVATTGDVDLGTLSVPANTTVSAYGATLVDDATAAAARATLEVGATSTTAALEAVGNAINTTGKYVGKMVFNTTTTKPVWAVGATAGSVWADHAGVTSHSPV